MRIALVSREYPPFFGGGIGTYARLIAPALAAEGCTVHIVTQSHDDTHGRVAVAGRVIEHRVPFETRHGWAKATARFAVDAARVVARLAVSGAIDVVEFAECEGAGAAMTALRAARAHRAEGVAVGVPVVVHMHSPTELLFALGSFEEHTVSGPWATRFMMERASILFADRLCAPSAYHARWCERSFQLERTPDVVPLAYAAPEAPPPAGEDVRTVMYLGRIEPRKGVESLVRAWEQVASARPGWTLRMVGSDTRPLGASMRERLIGGLSERTRAAIRFVDAVPPAQLARQFGSAAISVVPSLWENFPFTCVEAMAHARPVVVSDEGGMSEMIDGTDAGVVHRAGDDRDLARALLGMIDEPAARRAERGRIGRERIVSMCDPQTIARARIALYESAIRSPRSRTAAAARLDLWRRTRDAAAGERATALPALPENIRRWLPAEVAA